MLSDVMQSEGLLFALIPRFGFKSFLFFFSHGALQSGTFKAVRYVLSVPRRKKKEVFCWLQVAYLHFTLVVYRSQMNFNFEPM